MTTPSPERVAELVASRAPAVQTTEAKARHSQNGRHLIKSYDGSVSWVGRFPTPEDAQRAMQDEVDWLARFRAQYSDEGLTPPPRPWTFEVV